MDFNDLLQAGTGLLQGKTQGELFQRQQEERRVNALATQMHNTIEMARAQDLLQTSSLNRQVTLNADRRADAGEARAQAGFLHEGRDIPYQQFVELDQQNTLRGNELLRDQTVGFAREDAANFAGAYGQQTGRAPGEDVALMGGRIEMLPGGTPLMIPNLQSDAAVKSAQARAILDQNNATVAGIEATRAGMVWQAEAPRLLTDINRQLSVRALQDEADAVTALKERAVAELELKITQDTSEAAQRLAVADAISKLEAMVAFGQLKVAGELPEWMTPEMFLEQQGLVFEHDLRMDEIAGQTRAQMLLKQTPGAPTTQYSGYTPERAGLEATRLQIEGTNAQARLVSATASLLKSQGELSGGSSQADVEAAVGAYLDATRPREDGSIDYSQLAAARKKLDELKIPEEEMGAAISQAEQTLRSYGGGSGASPLASQGDNGGWGEMP